MRFRGGIDLARLPFPDRSVDIMVSQFGLEYAGLAEAVGEVARVCNTSFLALVHARDGEVCRQAREQVAQVAWLLETVSLADRLTAALSPYAPDRLWALQMEIAGRAQGSGNSLVLDGTAAFIGALRGAGGANPAEADNFAAQLDEHAQRMRAMVEAAPTLDQLKEAANLLRDRNFDVRVEACKSSDHLVGHWIEARRAPE